jgi:hypothetical protein
MDFDYRLAPALLLAVRREPMDSSPVWGLMAMSTSAMCNQSSTKTSMCCLVRIASSDY